MTYSPRRPLSFALSQKTLAARRALACVLGAIVSMSILLSVTACTIVCGIVWLCTKRRPELRSLLHRFERYARPTRKDPSEQAGRAVAALDSGEQLRRRATKVQRQQQQRANRLAEELAEEDYHADKNASALGFFKETHL